MPITNRGIYVSRNGIEHSPDFTKSLYLNNDRLEIVSNKLNSNVSNFNRDIIKLSNSSAIKRGGYWYTLKLDNTFKVPTKCPPPLINFRLFPTPRTLTETHHLLILKKLSLFTNPPFHSLLVLFTANFHGKIACLCIYSSFMLSDICFCSFHRLIITSSSFSISDSPIYFDPRLLNFRLFSNPRLFHT